MVRSETTSVSMSSLSSSLSRSLPEGARELTSLCPLDDRSKLQVTPALDAMATDLENTGFYEVGWDSGRIQIHPTGTPPTELYSSNSALIDAFINPTLHSSRRLLRPRTQSSLTFCKGRGADRPGTAQSVDLGDLESLRRQHQQQQQLRPSTGSGGSGRFSRLAQSVESINQLKGPGAGVAAANVQALASGSPSHRLRPSASRPYTPELRPSTPSNRPATSQQASCDRPLTSGRPLTPAVGWAAGARPSTPSVVDLNGTAGAGLEASACMGGRDSMSRGHVSPVNLNVSSMRTKRAHPMSSFRAQRSHAFIVYSDLDKNKNGKITKAQLEQSSLALGLTLEQANKFFDRLDPTGKGYISVKDWGKPELSKATETFAQMYLHKFLGLPDIKATDEQVKRYWNVQTLKQAKNLPAAINHVRVNAMSRGVKGLTSAEAVMDVFSFIDSSNTGEMSKDEVKQGFFALGVNITDDITDQIFKVFDKNDQGTVEYQQVLTTLFPPARVD
eukprot:gene19989-26704_t